MFSRNAKNWKPLFEIVHGVLNRHWDPIGVFPEVEDEYNDYALSITHLLLEGADAQKIADRLTNFECVSMGFSDASSERNLGVAEKLISLVQRNS